MKNFFKVFAVFCTMLSGCTDSAKKEAQLSFGVSSEYPPFEFMQNGEVVGFDIDVAKAVAKEMEMEAVFKDMKFASILPAIDNGVVDAGISAINITPARSASYDFTIPYHYFSIAGIFKDTSQIVNKGDLADKEIACQIGSNPENWIKTNFPGKAYTAFDGTNQAMEFLKSGRGDVVIVDGEVAVGFVKHNPGYKYVTLEKSAEAVGIVLKKGSALVDKMNKALEAIVRNGTLQALKKKWDID